VPNEVRPKQATHVTENDAAEHDLAENRTDIPEGKELKAE
jgi:hypothetical protein